MGKPGHIPEGIERVSYVDLRDAHKGDPFIVVACGPSAAGFRTDFRCVGVNDAAKFGQPLDYLVFVDPPQSIGHERWPWVRDYTGHVMSVRFNMFSKPEWQPFAWSKWTQLVLKPANQNTPAHWKGLEKEVHQGYQSTFVAMVVAMWLGASRVGIIGMDLTKGHSLWPHQKNIDIVFKFFLERCGVPVYNLSPNSAVTAVPKCSQEEFEAL